MSRLASWPIPFDLSRRAQQLESKLTGDDRLVLTRPDPARCRTQLKSMPGVSGVKLWDLPFRTLRDQLTFGKAARHREALAFEPFAVRPFCGKPACVTFKGGGSASAKPGG